MSVISVSGLVVAAVAAFSAALLSFVGHAAAEGPRLVQREVEFVALVAAGLVARGVRIAVTLVERVAGAAYFPDGKWCDYAEDYNALRAAGEGMARRRGGNRSVAGSGSTGAGSGPG